MIQSMCLRGCELVCIPCQTGVGIFNNYEEVYVPNEIHTLLYEKYEKDINKLAFERGGVTCNQCGSSEGNNCDLCNIDYEYLFKDQKVND